MLAFDARMRPVRHLLGVRLRALRSEQGLRAVDAATMAGIKESHLCSIERGEGAPSLDLLIALAMVYKVDLADLFTSPGTHARHDARELVRLTPTAKLAELREAMEKVVGLQIPHATRSKAK